MSLVNEIRQLKQQLADATARVEELSEKLAAEKAARDKAEQNLAAAVEAVRAAEEARKLAEAKQAEAEKQRDDHKRATDEALAKIAKLEAQLALAPHADVVGGAEKPVKSGETAEAVSHLEKVNSLKGAEKMKYYMEHKAEIDAEMRQLGM